MKKILVVGSRHDQLGEKANLQKYHSYFQRTVGEDMHVCYALLDDLVFDIFPKRFSVFDKVNNNELSEYKLIIFRGKLRNDSDVVFAISHYARLYGIHYFNDYQTVRSTSKLSQAVI